MGTIQCPWGWNDLFHADASNKKRKQPYLIIAGPAPLPSADPTLLISVPEYFVQHNNIKPTMRFALSLLLAAAGTYHAVDAFVPRTTLLVPTERIGTNSQLAVSTGSLPEIGINKLESIDSSALSSLLLGEENSTDRLVREFTEWAQPQVEALADYGAL